MSQKKDKKGCEKVKVNSEMLEFDLLIRKHIGRLDKDCACCINESAREGYTLADHQARKDFTRRMQWRKASWRYRNKLNNKYSKMHVEKVALIKKNADLEQKAETLREQIIWLKGLLQSKK
jgi:hypothetical protein